MKKFFTIIIFSTFLHIPYACCENIYHGIDVDKIYENGDWSSKEFIVQLIDDYELFLHVKHKFKKCPAELPDDIKCFDDIAKQLLQNFYTEQKSEWDYYIEYKNAAQKVYTISACKNKIAGPGGMMCKIDTKNYVADVIKSYVQTLISSLDTAFDEYYPFLRKYKRD